MQRYGGTWGAKYHPRRRREVMRLWFAQDDVRFELRGVRCSLPTIRPECTVRALHFYGSASYYQHSANPSARPLAIDLPAEPHLSFPSVAILSHRPRRQPPSGTYGEEGLFMLLKADPTFYPSP